MTKKLKTACDIGQKIGRLTIVAELPKNIRGHHPCDAVNHRLERWDSPKMQKSCGCCAQPALCGRQLSCGFFQSMPSSM
jgi:hypothetical protein